MKFGRVIYFLIVSLFFALGLSGGVLSRFDINGVSGSLNDYGQFNNDLSFNNNPVSVGNADSKSVELGYVRFYNSSGYNLNAFNLNTAINLDYLKAGVSLGFFLDSDDVVSYNEVQMRIAFASDYLISQYIKNLMVGVGTYFTLENLNVDSSENASEYKDTDFNLDGGVSYFIRQLKFSVGVKSLLDNPYFIGGIGYKFSRISVVGVSLKYADLKTDLSIGFSNSIIDDILNLYFGVNRYKVSTSIDFRMFAGMVKTGKMFFNYTFNYNFLLADTHYLSVKYEF